jgi:hypothetical protein
MLSLLIAMEYPFERGDARVIEIMRAGQVLKRQKARGA